MSRIYFKTNIRVLRSVLTTIAFNSIKKKRLLTPTKVYKLYNVQVYPTMYIPLSEVAVFYEQNLAGNITFDEHKVERV